MGQVTIRTSVTATARIAFSPWIQTGYEHSIIQINQGSNPLSKVEVVSALNSFNLARLMYEYYYYGRPEKYNPKIYLSTVQSVSTGWNQDLENAQKYDQKSGSWPNIITEQKCVLLHFC